MNYKKLTEVEKILYRELYKKSFYDFVKDFWCCVDNHPFIDGKFPQYLCEVAQYISREFVSYKEVEIKVPEGDDDTDVVDIREGKRNYAISICPRHGKSLVYSVLLPVWIWLQNPIQAASVCHSERLATDMNLKRQRLINSDQFRFFFPEIKLVANSASMIRNSEGSEMYAINRAAILGRGVDLICNDDIVNYEMARRDAAEMESVFEYYTHVMPSRINNINKYLVLCIMQRLALNDPIGRIKNSPELSSTYTFITMPAQFKKKTIWVCPISGDLLTYEKDSYLWPERFGNYEAIRQQVGESAFQTEYMQDPVASDSLIFKPEMIIEKDRTEVPDISEAEVIYASTDFAVKDSETADFTGSVIAYKVGSTLYIADAMEKRLSFVKASNYVKQIESLYPGIIHVVEDKTGGNSIIAALRDTVPGIQPYNPGAKGKSERAELSTPYLIAGNVVLVRNKWNEEIKKYTLSEGMSKLKERLTFFPFVDHDDVVDAFTQLILFVFLDRRYMVYGRSFNDQNIIKDGEVPYDYSTVFFNRDGDNVKALEVGVKYGSTNSLVALRERAFKANAHDTLSQLKLFAGRQSVAIDCSAMNSMGGMYAKNLTVERYEIDDFNKSVTELNLAFSKKRVVINEKCLGLKGDIENFKYDNTKDDNARYRSYKDGFVACLRVAMKYYGGI